MAKGMGKFFLREGGMGNVKWEIILNKSCLNNLNISISQ